jgi:DNA topoisomerase-3
MRRIVLNVAEKPSIAKSITDFLNQGGVEKEHSKSQYNPIFKFKRRFKDDQEAILKVTSVTGHIQEIYFNEKYREWQKWNPLELITTAEVFKKFAKDKIGIVENITHLSRQATDIVLWLDCDREGEAIAFEVLSICNSSNRHLGIHRARFSANTRADIIRAFEDLKKPDKGLSDVTIN